MMVVVVVVVVVADVVVVVVAAAADDDGDDDDHDDVAACCCCCCWRWLCFTHFARSGRHTAPATAVPIEQCSRPVAPRLRSPFDGTQLLRCISKQGGPLPVINGVLWRYNPYNWPYKWVTGVISPY